MATSSFGRNYSLSNNKADEFIGEMSRPALSTLQSDFCSKLTNEKLIRPSLQKALNSNLDLNKLIDSLIVSLEKAYKFTETQWNYLDYEPTANMQTSILLSILHILSGNETDADIKFLKQFSFWTVFEENLPLKTYSYNQIEILENRLLKLMKEHDYCDSDSCAAELLLRYLLSQSNENEHAFNKWFSFKIYDLLGQNSENTFKLAFLLREKYVLHCISGDGRRIEVYCDSICKFYILYDPFSKDWIYQDIYNQFVYKNKKISLFLSFLSHIMNFTDYGKNNLLCHLINENKLNYKATDCLVKILELTKLLKNKKEY